MNLLISDICLVEYKKTEHGPHRLRQPDRLALGRFPLKKWRSCAFSEIHAYLSQTPFM